MKDKEIEIKVSLEHIQPLRDFLKKKGTFKYKTVQIDEYFTPAHRDFVKAKPMREWLRLRNANGTYFITYKYYHFDSHGRSTYCDEYESKLESISAFKKIFRMLDFKPQVIVHKEREVWHYNNYEVALDNVKKLGAFVEIEYKGKKMSDLKKIRADMIEFLKSLHTGKIMQDYIGYPSILMFPQDRKQVEV